MTRDLKEEEEPGKMQEKFQADGRAKAKAPGWENSVCSRTRRKGASLEWRDKVSVEGDDWQGWPKLALRVSIQFCRQES